MRLALISPSNKLYMPYLDNYLKILNEMGINYDVINWDRLKIENDNRFTYEDSKKGQHRNFLDYFRYSRFVIAVLKEYKYDKIIVFGLQLVFFLRRYLLKKYSNKYIIDIRDYNRIIKYFNIKKIIDNSYLIVLSSPGYKNWLPKSMKYVINHNTLINSISEVIEVDETFIKKNKIKISYIGSIRDLKINLDFIEALKNSKRFVLVYNGEGIVNQDIVKYISKKEIKNVELTGRYDKENELELYKNSNIINTLIPNNSINSRTLLPNRLYNAIIQGKIVLVYKGTYLAKLVEQYNLGIILNSFDNVECNILNFLKYFDVNKYDTGRRKFLERVISDNFNFITKIRYFLSQET